MLRAFSMFPTGPVGFGLAALRIGVGALFLIDVLPFADLVISGWGTVMMSFLALLIVFGALTPYLYVAFCIVEFTKMFSLTGMKALHLFGFILITGSLALIGPGAYSLDARLFGHRRIIQLRETDK